MKCRICGKENAAEAVKCKQCNALLRKAEAPKSAPEEEAPLRNVPVLIAVGGVGLIVILAVVYFALLRRPIEQTLEPAAAPQKTVALEQEIAEEMARMEKTEQQDASELSLEGIYGPASFATREAIMRYSFAVKELEERRAGHDHGWQAWHVEVMKRVQNSDRTPEEKAALTKKLDVALSASAAQRAKARAASKQWAHVTLDLYDYAQDNAEHIDARGEEVRFGHSEVAAGFRARLARAQRLQQESDKLLLQATEIRHTKLKEAGIVPPG